MTETRLGGEKLGVGEKRTTIIRTYSLGSICRDRTFLHAIARSEEKKLIGVDIGLRRCCSRSWGLTSYTQLTRTLQIRIAFLTQTVAGWLLPRFSSWLTVNSSSIIAIIIVSTTSHPLVVVVFVLLRLLLQSVLPSDSRAICSRCQSARHPVSSRFVSSDFFFFPFTCTSFFNLDSIG